MKWKQTGLRSRLYLAAAVILLAGLSGASLIYLAAGDNAGISPLIDDPGRSKKYVHDLEVYGGKMNVFMDQFIRWFEGLWTGRQLAFTVLCIAVVLAAGCCLAAHNLPPGAESRRDE